MFSHTETENIGSGNSTPIKSSLSVFLNNDQILLNSASDSCRNVISRRSHGQSGSTVGSRGDYKERSANFSDISGFRNMDKETFDKFTKRLVQRHIMKKRTMDKKTGKNDRRTKKSRQIFTFSRPRSFQQSEIVAARRPLNEGIEIYESISGATLSCKETERWQQETRQPSPTFTHSRSRRLRRPEVVPLPRVVPAAPENTRIDPYDSISSCDTQIFFPERLLTPDQQPGMCFPRAKSQPDLYYTISDRSMPLKHYTSAHSFGDTLRKNQGLINWQDDSHIGNCRENINKTYAPMIGTSPVSASLEEDRNLCRPPGQRPPKSPRAHSKDQYASEMKKSESFFLGCQELNDFLSKKMAKTLTGISILPTRGRLMSYAKFNSSFKISEDFYEDINRRSISRAPTAAESLAAFSFRGPDSLEKNLDYVHKLNPDFDENQSLTEALTAIRSPYQSSSVTSVALRSDLITKVYHHFARSVDQEKSGRGETLAWIRAPEAVSTSEMALRLEKKQIEDEFLASSAVSQMDQKSGCVGLSNDSVSCVPLSNDSVSCVPLSRLVSAIRKQHLTELKISLKNARNHPQKETDLWSNSNLSSIRSDPMEVSCGDQLSRRKLCDVISQTGVFNSSSAELYKRPFWTFKLSPVLDAKRSKLVQDFVSKAHHYMCGKDYQRSALNRCYFRRSPAVRLTDQSTQFPDSYSKICDRQAEIGEPKENEILSVEAAAYCHIVQENCHIDRESCSGELERYTDHSLEEINNFGCSGTYHCQTFETEPSNNAGCHRHVSRMSFTEINCLTCPNRNAPVYCTKSDRLVEEPQGLVHSETVYENAQPDQTSLLNHDLECTESVAKQGPISHSFRALCDKRRIRIKYENGKYTVYKEVDQVRRRTVWSLLSGKATNLLSSVIPKKTPPKRSFRTHKSCS